MRIVRKEARFLRNKVRILRKMLKIWDKSGNSEKKVRILLQSKFWEKRIRKGIIIKTFPQATVMIINWNIWLDYSLAKGNVSFHLAEALIHRYSVNVTIKTGIKLKSKERNKIPSVLFKSWRHLCVVISIISKQKEDLWLITLSFCSWIEVCLSF